MLRAGQNRSIRPDFITNGIISIRTTIAEIMEFDLDFGKQLKLASFNRINHRDRVHQS
jgi:hypothetical protein